jgi:hypothetical protein
MDLLSDIPMAPRAAQPECRKALVEQEVQDAEYNEFVHRSEFVSEFATDKQNPNEHREIVAGATNSWEREMRQVLAVAVTILLLGYCSVGAFARGGTTGGHLTGTGYVNPSSHYTHEYFRSNGTYVHGYHATNPNAIGTDNYSTKGNINPWTGQPGTHYVDR